MVPVKSQLANCPAQSALLLLLVAPDVSKAEAYLDVSAICGKIHLDDKAWDIFAVANAVQTCALSEVIEVHCVFRRTNG